MKKQNVVIYGVYPGIGYTLWQLFDGEHRIFTYDKDNRIPGAPYFSKITEQRINISLAEYKPINSVILTRYHVDDVISLFNSIQKEQTNGKIEVLIKFETDLEKTIASIITDSYDDVSITWLHLDKQIELLEDLYHIESLHLISESKESADYWEEFFRAGLPFLKNITKENENGLAL